MDQADVGRDAPGKPKTLDRCVPLPPQTVAVLREWVDHSGMNAGFLFRTRTGRRPTLSNWRRCLVRGCRLTGIDALSPYDLRHIMATTMVACQVPLGETAWRLGHSVEELVRTYVDVVEGDEDLGNQRLETLFAAESTAALAVDEDRNTG